MVARPLIHPFMMSISSDTLTQLIAATSENAKRGQYYEPVAKDGPGSKSSQDPKLAAEFWDRIEEQLARHGYEIGQERVLKGAFGRRYGRSCGWVSLMA